MSSTPDSNERDPANWLDAHGDMLYRFAILRVQNEGVAEDLVQETLVKAFKNFAKFRGDASIRTWLTSILKNEIAGYFRKNKREQTARTTETIDLSSLLHPKMENGEFRTQVEKDEFWVRVNECFDELPAHLLETFMFRLSNPDERIEFLCNELGITSSNFSVRLFRTRLMLRQCLEKNWLKESN